MNRPTTVESAPIKTINSNAGITNAGSEMIGFPPVISGQFSEVHIPSAKPLPAPVSPPTRVNSRTGTSGVCNACSSSCRGVGENTTMSRSPFSRSPSMAAHAASTSAKMASRPDPFRSLIATPLLRAMRTGRAGPAPAETQRHRQHFLQLRDRHRREHPHEEQEPQEEPREAPQQDRHLDPRRLVVLPLPGLVLLRQARNDDHEPLEP